MHSGSAGTLALVLRGSGLGEARVLALALLVALAAVVLLRLRLSFAALRRLFIVASIICLAAIGVIAAGWFELYSVIYQEDHVLEWLAADFLLAGSVIGLAVTVRQALRRRPSPVGLFLTGGYFLAFCRELEFGGPFYGAKLWHKSSLVTPRAYLDPSYFESQIRKLQMAHSPETLYVVHLCTAGLLILLGAIAIVYILRHHRLFRRQLRQLPATSYGRYFLIGLGAFLAAHVVGKVIHWVHDAMKVKGFPHRLIEEPIEFWGAMTFFFSMLAMWMAARNERAGRLGG